MPLLFPAHAARHASLRQLYSAALEQCSGDNSVDTTSLRATVLTNRAMVLFKQGKVSFAQLPYQTNICCDLPAFGTRSIAFVSRRGRRPNNDTATAAVYFRLGYMASFGYIAILHIYWVPDQSASNLGNSEI